MQWLETVGFLLAAWMWFQQIRIYRRRERVDSVGSAHPPSSRPKSGSVTSGSSEPETPDSDPTKPRPETPQLTSLLSPQLQWRRCAQAYRRDIRLTILGGATVWIVLTVLLIQEHLLHESRMLDDYTIFFSTHRTPLILLLIAFFTGAIRLLVERAADDGQIVHFLRDLLDSFFRKGALKETWKKLSLGDMPGASASRAWLWWFTITTIIAFSIHIFPWHHMSTLISSSNARAGQSQVDEAATTRPSDSAAPGETDTTTGGGDSAIGNEESTIHSGLLILAIGVNTIGLFGYFCWIYIGIFNKLTQVHHFNDKAARLFVGSIGTNEIPQQAVVIGSTNSGKTAFVNAYPFDPKDSRSKTAIVQSFSYDAHGNTITAIDAPGENLGDHLMIASRYRADCLVLIIDVSSIDPDALPNEQLYDVEGCDKLMREGHPTAAYLRALAYATRRDAGSISPSEVFRVRSFMLYINAKTDAERVTLAKFNHAHFSRLATSIGDRFGVEEDDCCAVGGNGVAAGSARQLIGLAPAERMQSAIWPKDETGSKERH